MEPNKEVLEVILQRFEDSKAVKRVISWEEVGMLGPGENYASAISRINMTVVLGNGRVAKRSVILKKLPLLKQVREVYVEGDCFVRELKIYATVIDEMEALMEEFEDSKEVLFCKMLHYVPYTTILLEDLQVSGFRMVPRKDTCDMEHSILVLKSLGRFHGMAKVLEERGVFSKREYARYAFTDDLLMSRSYIYDGFQLFVDAIDKYWGNEWKGVVKKLRIPWEDVRKEFKTFSDVDESKFNCLNHGDCWSNNLMFKYDCNNRPCSLRFIDLQFCHYGSPSADVMFFLFTSVGPKLRQCKMQILVECWYDSLIETLDRYGYTGEKPTFEEFDEEIKSVKCAMFHFIIMNIVTRADSDYPFSIEVDATSGSKNYVFDESIFRDDTLRLRWGPELIDLAHKLP